MLVFVDGVLRLHHLGRGCREFKNGLASIMKITPFSPADQEHVNTEQVVELVLEHHQDTKIYPLHWSDLRKLYTTLSMYNWDAEVCVRARARVRVCMVGTKISD